MTPIDIQVSRSKVKPILYMLGKGGISVLQTSTSIFWLRITDEGSLPEMRIWSILLIISDLKWCIYLSRSLFPYFNFLVSVTAGGPRSPRGHV